MKLGYRLYVYVGSYFEIHQAANVFLIQNKSYQQSPKK